MNLFIELIGWTGTLLTVGAYVSNLYGYLSAEKPLYVWLNLVGSVCLVANTLYHSAFSSMAESTIWAFFALVTLLHRRKQPVTA
jgi:uncharacterized membrane protein